MGAGKSKKRPMLTDVNIDYNILTFNDDALNSATFKGTKTLQFCDLIHEARCKVLKVYDGDTITVALPLDNGIFKIRCRCARYNSAEMKSGDQGEIDKAVESRDFLSQIILDKIIIVEFGKYDKWGRPLIEMFSPGRDINYNDLMLKRGYGMPYKGRGEKKF